MTLNFIYSIISLFVGKVNICAYRRTRGRSRARRERYGCARLFTAIVRALFSCDGSGTDGQNNKKGVRQRRVLYETDPAISQTALETVSDHDTAYRDRRGGRAYSPDTRFENAQRGHRRLAAGRTCRHRRSDGDSRDHFGRRRRTQRLHMRRAHVARGQRYARGAVRQISRTCGIRLPHVRRRVRHDENGVRYHEHTVRAAQQLSDGASRAHRVRHIARACLFKGLAARARTARRACRNYRDSCIYHAQRFPALPTAAEAAR